MDSGDVFVCCLSHAYLAREQAVEGKRTRCSLQQLRASGRVLRGVEDEDGDGQTLCMA